MPLFSIFRLFPVLSIFSFPSSQYILYIMLLVSNDRGCKRCPDAYGNFISATILKNNINYNLYSEYSDIKLAERNISILTQPELALDVERNTSTFILYPNDSTLPLDTIFCTYKTNVEYLDGRCGMQFDIMDFKVRSTFSKTEIVNFDLENNIWNIQFQK